MAAAGALAITTSGWPATTAWPLRTSTLVTVTARGADTVDVADGSAWTTP